MSPSLKLFILSYVNRNTVKPEVELSISKFNSSENVNCCPSREEISELLFQIKAIKTFNIDTSSNNINKEFLNKFSTDNQDNQDKIKNIILEEAKNEN